MKRMLLIVIALGFVAGMMAQISPVIPKVKSDFKVLRPTYKSDGNVIGFQGGNSTVANKAVLDDPSTQVTRYDLQTNSSNQNRLFWFSDGTMGATCTWGAVETAFADRGTGYNYFDGSAWGPQPTGRIEGSTRTGWPSYAAWGANGECVISHASGTAPLYFSTRATKGTGTWTMTTLAAPSGATGLLWPRMVTNGPDHMYVHVIALTAPAANGGAPYMDLDGALIYTRSLDGGATWEAWRLLDGMTSADYLAFGGDTYAFAEPVGDNIAFVIGDSWYDNFIMKSTDNGVTWTKTIFYASLYNKYVNGPNDTTPMFYCPDGASAIAMDQTGEVHVAFGLQRAKGDADGQKWYPFTDGLIYWNETMGELPQVMDPDTLYNHGNYIGWVQDTNVFYAQTTELAYYYISLSGMPTIVCDEWNNVFVTWSSVTTLRDPNSYMLRHLFSRASIDNGATWRDTIVDITGDFLYTWSECVFACAAPYSNDKLAILFQADAEGGSAVKASTNPSIQGQTNYTNNDMILIMPNKADIVVPDVAVEKKNVNAVQVSQNSPNPVQDLTTVNVNQTTAGNLTLDVYSLLGQKVMSINKGYQNPGNSQFVINGGQLPSGVYFYTVTVNNQSVTKKMIVQ